MPQRLTFTNKSPGTLGDIHRSSREKRKLGDVFEGNVVDLSSARKLRLENPPRSAPSSPTSRSSWPLGKGVRISYAFIS